MVNIKGVPIFRKGSLFDVGGNYIPAVLKINHCFFSFSDSQTIGGEEFPADRCINDMVKTKRWTVSKDWVYSLRLLHHHCKGKAGLLSSNTTVLKHEVHITVLVRCFCQESWLCHVIKQLLVVLRRFVHCRRKLRQN